MSAEQKYKDYEKRIPPDKLEKQVDFESKGVQLHLHMFAQEMDYWDTKVANLLGLKKLHIKDIKHEHSTLEGQRIACLQKWMGMCGSSATYKVLLDVFLQTENEEAAKVIVKVLGDKPVAGHPQAAALPQQQNQGQPQLGTSGSMPQLYKIAPKEQGRNQMDGGEPEALPPAAQPINDGGEPGPQLLNVRREDITQVRNRQALGLNATPSGWTVCPCKCGLLVCAGVVVIIAVGVAWYSANKEIVKPLFTQASDIECHKMNVDDSLSLEKYLRNVNVKPQEKLCSRLELENCNDLERAGKLDPFNLADQYLKQKPDACWEHFVSILCELLERQVANTVAKEHEVNYQKHCV